VDALRSVTYCSFFFGKFALTIEAISTAMRTALSIA
jgi:hypothetical protein